MKNISTKSMAPSPLLPLCLLLFLATAYGRTMKQAHFHNIINTTNSNDVEGLVALMKKFPALRLPYLSRDPCYPHKLIWIECNNDVVPRVTALYLGARNLSGNIPDFSSMDALKRIYLQRNSLYGPIPQFLGTFPQLTYLDLSNNHFSGALPDSLANNQKIKLNLAGNSMQLPPPATTAVQLPPPIPTAKVIFPRRLEFLFPPVTPKPLYQFPPPAGGRGGGGGGGGGGSGNSNMLRVAGRINRITKILKFTLLPGAVAVLGTVYGICRCRRRRTANSDATNNSDAKP